jgi:hypothetical protein
MRSLQLVIFAVVAASPIVALAQTTPSSPGPDQAPTLSEKLSKTDGVIKPPPSGDTEMTQPTPNVGTMPVIPPQAVTPPGQEPGQPKPEPK